MPAPSVQTTLAPEPCDFQGSLGNLSESGIGDLLLLAREVFEVPRVIIGVFDEHRERIKQETGLDIEKTFLDTPLLNHFASNSGTLIVDDLSQDDRFKNLSFVNKPDGLRFYAGVAIVVDGATIGMFSAVDTKPRVLAPRQIRNLRFFARQVALRFEHGRRSHQRTRAEAQLEQHKLNTLAFFKLSTLGEMASGIAHEINNPLAAIMSRAEQLVEIAEQDRDPRQHTKMIGQQIEKICLRIARTVNSVRNFARDEEFEPVASVSVSNLVEATLDICREKFKGDVGLDVTIAKDNPVVRCHPIQISQVLLNLLSNAHYAATQSESKWVRLEITNQIDDVEVSVTDSGPGVPIEIRRKIMQPFFTTKPIGLGTGIGLSISRKIVQEHGGELLLDETSPQTRFVFRLRK